MSGAKSTGLGPFQPDEIELVGHDPESLVALGFKLVRKPVYANASSAHYSIIKKAVLPRPVIDEAVCVRCAECVEACPVPGKAVRFLSEHRRGSPPVYDYDLIQSGPTKVSRVSPTRPSQPQ